MVKLTAPYLLVIAIFMQLHFSGTANAETNIGHLIEHNAKTCFRKPFSTYDEWLSMINQGAVKRFKDEQQQQASIAKFKSRFTRASFEKYQNAMSCQTVLYPSGGGKVQGFIIKPKQIQETLPVIVYNRGGNGRFGQVNLAMMMATLFPLAEQGFIVIGSQYRKPSKYSDPSFDDEFGGADVEDVLALEQLIPHIAGADASRVGVLGASRGVMQSYLALKAGLKAKALVTIAGNTDLQAGSSFRPEMENVYKKRIPNYDTDGPEQLKARSALYWIEELNPDMPILLLHGSDDDRVAAFHSVKMAEKLEALNWPHKLVIYPGDDHNLSQNRAVAMDSVVDWFKRHL